MGYLGLVASKGPWQGQHRVLPIVASIAAGGWYGSSDLVEHLAEAAYWGFAANTCKDRAGA
jgi:hypothetical protein